MKIGWKTLALFVCYALCAGFVGQIYPELIPVKTAEARGGISTPQGVLGASRRTSRRTARRTTRRWSAAEMTAVDTYTPYLPPPPQQQQPPPQPQPAPAIVTVPVGTIVPALPAGCVSVVVSGVSYSDCAGVFYKPAFQGEKLVYVAVEKPVK